MAPHWVAYRRPLVLVLLTIAVIVTIIFDASVEAQGAAYATGVLVLMLSAAVAVVLEFWRNRRDSGALVFGSYFVVVSLIFMFTLVDNVLVRPDGVVIAAVFIIFVVAPSAVSRYIRATELRVATISFADDESSELWKSLVRKKVHLVPLRRNTDAARERKAADLVH